MKIKRYNRYIFANSETRGNAHNYAWFPKYDYSYKHPYDEDPSRPERKHTLFSFSAVLTNIISGISKHIAWSKKKRITAFSITQVLCRQKLC